METKTCPECNGTALKMKIGEAPKIWAFIKGTNNVNYPTVFYCTDCGQQFALIEDKE